LPAIATTAYSHRLIAHRAAKDVRLPTHVIFLGLQLFALQGSVRRWSAQHVIHHAVDKTGQHHLDPYSTTWFDTGWRNFLWSHMLTYLFNHPPSREFDAAMNAKMHPAIIWQDKHYVPLLILANFALPIALGPRPRRVARRVLPAGCQQRGLCTGAPQHMDRQQRDALVGL
jgi:stearoyl-CoA desaturase (delta-9 desaturase)